MAEEKSVVLPMLSMDLVQSFQAERNLIINQEIDQELALRLMLLFRKLDLESHDPICLYINSGGGDVSAGLTIIDNMRLCKSPIHTLCYGMAASMAAVIFACGEKGHRYILPHSEIMIHQPWRSFKTDIKQSEFERISARFKRTRDDLESILAEASGKSLEEIHAACEYDNFLQAQEAVDMGLADVILK